MLFYRPISIIPAAVPCYILHQAVSVCVPICRVVLVIAPQPCHLDMRITAISISGGLLGVLGWSGHSQRLQSPAKPNHKINLHHNSSPTSELCESAALVLLIKIAHWDQAVGGRPLHYMHNAPCTLHRTYCAFCKLRPPHCTLCLGILRRRI